MRSIHRAALAAGLGVFMILGLASFGFAQAAAKPATTTTSASTGGTEKTVEEAYLQETMETLVIQEQSRAETKDMKLVALQYIKQAVDGGRKNEEIRKSLEYLALESTVTIIRSGGLGRPTNDFPDVRAKACDFLGEFPSVESKDALVKVALADREPMVLSAALRSLGKIGMNDGDEVTQIISYIVNRFDVLQPDNSLAFESLVALERIADKNGGIKDPAAIKSIIRIAGGNYITPVRAKANELLSKLRRYSATSASSATTTSGTGK